MTVSEPGSDPVTPTEPSAPRAGEQPVETQPAMAPPPMAPAPVSWAPPPPPRTGPMPGVSYAGFWVRLVALIVDALIIGGIAFAAVFLLASSAIVTSDPSNTAGAFLVPLMVLFPFAYFASFWAWHSRTPGMMPFNLRIVRADTGEAIGIGLATVRAIGLFILYLFWWLGGLLGLLWVAFDARKQGWHDKLAGTVVVRPT
jgi:uncharacterized RDD family membrane protein YckC